MCNSITLVNIGFISHNITLVSSPITIYYNIFKPLQLSGHIRVISATCFGQKTRPLLLCTASEDFIFIWNIDRILAVDNISECICYRSNLIEVNIFNLG